MKASALAARQPAKAIGMSLDVRMGFGARHEPPAPACALEGARAGEGERPSLE